MVAQVSLVSLWIPIVLSAVLVFVASSILHMVLTYHRSDFAKLPSEDTVMDALGPLSIPPGEYVFPHSSSPAEMKDPAFIDKVNKGPVAFMTVMPNGMPKMGGQLVQWFIYCVIVAIFAAYIATRALGPNPPYLSVFRFVGATAFIGYSVALWQNSIWYKRAWSSTLKSTVDGLVYALLTAGTFGWLWPA
ncbi:MAG: hypothetical protein OEO20_14185 [Gemmatimonadota bacterium]|nr:hypothetical protein [Gemmatimonadota bacterium]MDH3368333.1 hypothetical protein [Gemmatimonadota bacterium]MDH3479441.1 hypothetical protein [Gemmatimonadota bacterium]MDH3568816.1 hypothetical protein [Gemmatimonadota bacterium]MDH5550039.1 hypothetical protein [Gemmatimonadota bacterium]